MPRRSRRFRSTPANPSTPVPAKNSEGVDLWIVKTSIVFCGLKLPAAADSLRRQHGPRAGGPAGHSPTTSAARPHPAPSEMGDRLVEVVVVRLATDRTAASPACSRSVALARATSCRFQTKVGRQNVRLEVPVATGGSLRAGVARAAARRRQAPDTSPRSCVGAVLTRNRTPLRVGR
jgi:hypothetical protein